MLYLFRIVASSAAMASPTSTVVAVPPISPVLIPFSIIVSTASSMALASSGKHREYFSIMLMESIMATGLTIPLPEISGAEPMQR
jgi:hypothetical protein